MVVMKGGCEIRTVDRWFELASPKKGRDHWVDGRSALECARAWCAGAEGLAVPTELTALLASHPDTSGAVISSVTPEHQIRFDQLRGEPRNADVVALADHPSGLIAISIEAKADEPFDLQVHDVLLGFIKKISRDQRTNGVARVQQLASSLLPDPMPGTSPLGDLRYQLLTGVAGALAFAATSNASRAVFVVHEFVTNRTDDVRHRANADDLNAFVARLTAGTVSTLSPGELMGPYQIPGSPLFDGAPALYLGKAVRNLRAGSHTDP
jgi:hypothetical protein